MKVAAILVAMGAIIALIPGMGQSAQTQAGEGGLLRQEQSHDFSDAEIAVLRSLWIGSLPPLPTDPSNAVSDDPRAVQLGKKIFFDPRFSADKKISCATCHREEVSFTDNKPLAVGIGTSTRRNMPIIGLAYFKWFFWDGRADSLWAQALAPFENRVEQGITRCKVVSLVIEHYRQKYEEIFGAAPDITEKNCPSNATPVSGDPLSRAEWEGMNPADRETVNIMFSNTGKVLAAYMRLVVPTPSRFDRYVESLLKGDVSTMASVLSAEEIEGMRIFIGKAKCVECHSGPLFSDGAFHNVNVEQPRGVPFDRGRSEGIEKVLADEFNCYGKYSDADPRDCLALNTIETDAQKHIGAFKTPILRNVAVRPPYMHAGQFKTIAKVLAFYQYPFDFHLDFDLGHATLQNRELELIETFLQTLSSPLEAP